MIALGVKEIGVIAHQSGKAAAPTGVILQSLDTCGERVLALCRPVPSQQRQLRVVAPHVYDQRQQGQGEQKPPPATAFKLYGEWVQDK